VLLLACGYDMGYHTRHCCIPSSSKSTVPCTDDDNIERSCGILDLLFGGNDADAWDSLDESRLMCPLVSVLRSHRVVLVMRSISSADECAVIVGGLVGWNEWNTQESCLLSSAYDRLKTECVLTFLATYGNSTCEDLSKAPRYHIVQNLTFYSLLG
jgi:hypothetical protein